VRSAQEQGIIPTQPDGMDGVLDYDEYAQSVLQSAPSVVSIPEALIEKGCSNISRVKLAKEQVALGKQQLALLPDAQLNVTMQAGGLGSAVQPLLSGTGTGGPAVFTEARANADLNSSTGVITFGSPHSEILSVGTAVVARYKGGKKAFPGVILAVHSKLALPLHTPVPVRMHGVALAAPSTQTVATAAVHTWYDIRYDDGEVERRVADKHVRRRQVVLGSGAVSSDVVPSASKQADLQDAIKDVAQSAHNSTAAPTDSTSSACRVQPSAASAPTSAVVQQPTVKGSAVGPSHPIPTPTPTLVVGMLVQVLQDSQGDAASHTDSMWREARITSVAREGVDVRYTGPGGLRERVQVARIRTPAPPSANAAQELGAGPVQEKASAPAASAESSRKDAAVQRQAPEHGVAAVAPAISEAASKGQDRVQGVSPGSLASSVPSTGSTPNLLQPGGPLQPLSAGSGEPQAAPSGSTSKAEEGKEQEELPKLSAPSLASSVPPELTKKPAHVAVTALSELPSVATGLHVLGHDPVVAESAGTNGARDRAGDSKEYDGSTLARAANSTPASYLKCSAVPTVGSAQPAVAVSTGTGRPVDTRAPVTTASEGKYDDGFEPEY
jgi:hypothetical protein